MDIKPSWVILDFSFSFSFIQNIQMADLMRVRHISQFLCCICVLVASGVYTLFAICLFNIVNERRLRLFHFLSARYFSFFSSQHHCHWYIHTPKQTKKKTSAPSFIKLSLSTRKMHTKKSQIRYSVAFVYVDVFYLLPFASISRISCFAVVGVHF